MKILICGICGHMGKEVIAAAKTNGDEVVAGVDACFDGGLDGITVTKNFGDMKPHMKNVRPDIIIDFSHHSLTGELIGFATEFGIPTVVATTGQTPEEIEMIKKAAESIPVFFSANMSLGIALLTDLVKRAVAVMPDAEIEIIEKHHDRKLDAPSGTALMLADAIREVRPEAYAVCGRSGHGARKKEEIGISSLRMGNMSGEHEVIIATRTQTITLKHEAHDRALFADGAIAAASFLCKKGAGLYTMRDMF